MRIPQTAKIDRLDDHLQAAVAVTEQLLRVVMENPRERLSTIHRMGKARQIDRLLAAGAYTDAALVLLNIELPNWKVRRLVLENGEWLCSLSRHHNIPVAVDDPAEASHPSMPVAVLRALIEVRRRITQDMVSLVPRIAATVPLEIVCCDNFA